MRPIAHFTSAAALSFLATASATPAIAQASGDLTFTIKSTSGAPGRATSILERFLISGSRVRMEISTDPSNPAMGGMYNVMNSADSTFTSVMPQAHMALIARMPPTFAADLDVGTMAVSDITKDSIEDLGPGERLAGHDTQHYRISRAGTLKTTTNGRTCSHTFDSIEDVWIATDATADAELRSAERRMAAMTGMRRSAGESWTDVFDAATRNRPPRGLALRTVRKSKNSGASEKPDEGSYTMEYTELSNSPIDSALFAVPNGFQVQDMRGMTLPGMNALAGNVGGAIDSARGC